MSPIKILDTHTINKIAAGEVVERPASVVKELVENSIDAKASLIVVEIKNGGIDLIRITDNGKGIPKDEVEIAFLRHATSKITQAEDLEEVISLGFRGEALASIASVAKVELITKEPEELTGKRVTLEAGKLQTSDEIACPDGTTLIMRHLFYNIPARKAFLKSTGTEGSKITDYMYKLALAHPEISFKYIQNGKLLFNTPGSNQLKDTVLSLYGKEIVKNTLVVDYQKDELRVVGLIGNPSISRGNRSYEQFFINGRYIKSPLMQKAVEAAYKTLMMVGKFPFVILHLNMSPSLVDVNVHPTKLEVRFKQEEKIYQAIYHAVYDELYQQNKVRQVNNKPQIKPQEPLDHKATKQVMMESLFTPRKTNNTLDYNKLVTKEEATPLSRPIEPVTAEPTIQYNPEPLECKEIIDKPQPNNKVVVPVGEIAKLEEVETAKESESSECNERASSPSIGTKEEQVKPKEGIDYFIVGQLFNTYWLIRYQEEVLIIDQHAAHERVMYEKYMKQFSTKEVPTQVLLVPYTLTMTAKRAVFIEEYQHKLDGLGFKIEKFGDNRFIVREVPYLFNHPMHVEELERMLDQLEDIVGVNSIYELEEERIIRQACKSAIRAHDHMTRAECIELIEYLLASDNPYTCPHGRPTIVSLSEKDIQKIFKRI